MTDLKEKAKKLGIKVLVSNWNEYCDEPCIKKLLQEEDTERQRLSLEKRLKDSHVSHVKPMAEFDWSWPKVIDRELVEELFNLDFISKSYNVVLLSANGLGKTMVAKNLVYKALLAGYESKFVQASQMLADLSSQDGATKLRSCLKKYTGPQLLAIDEIGYLSYDNRYADLLYEVINGRYMKSSTIITTNKPFKEWGEIFPNAGCVVTLVDRLMHKAELVTIAGNSYRQHEAQEDARQRASKKSGKKNTKGGEKNVETTDPS